MVPLLSVLEVSPQHKHFRGRSNALPMNVPDFTEESFMEMKDLCLL